LGPNDVVQVDVLRHPEFSDKFAVNQDGMIQYNYLGDIPVNGLTKKQLEDKLKGALTKYVVAPEVSVTILEYGSKVFYILGEVASPGQFVMKSEGITLRDAIHLAGLPTINASMRKCRLITPTSNGKRKIKNVDLYALLYYGDLRKNVVIKPGDIFYVPSTAIAKGIRIVSPIATLVGLAASPVESAASGKTALHDLKKNIPYNQ
jgi:polysaccharide export outer membrane protein